MTETMELGPTPSGESCLQLGAPDYSPEGAKQECRKYVKFLEARFPEAPDFRCSFKIKGFPHDFGTYYEVIIVFNDEDERASAFAYFVEANIPEYWSEVNVMKFEMANKEG